MDLKKITVLLSSGEIDEWTGTPRAFVNMEHLGALYIYDEEDGDRLIACYAAGMWMKYEVEELEEVGE